MEALLEKEAGKVENWNDDRLNELSRRMDAGFKEMREGFARVDREMKEGFARVDGEMKEGFAQVGDRIDRLTNTVIIGGAGFCAAIVAAAVFG
jgi:hypothetical protein